MRSRTRASGTPRRPSTRRGGVAHRLLVRHSTTTRVYSSRGDRRTRSDAGFCGSARARQGFVRRFLRCAHRFAALTRPARFLCLAIIGAVAFYLVPPPDNAGCRSERSRCVLRDTRPRQHVGLSFAPFPQSTDASEGVQLLHLLDRLRAAYRIRMECAAGNRIALGGMRAQPRVRKR